jgi:hypothetical protein
MFTSKLSLGAVAALALASSANAIAVDLTADNFDSLVGAGKGSFIKFYAPWCVGSIANDVRSRYSARVAARRRARGDRSRVGWTSMDLDRGVILFFPTRVRDAIGDVSTTGGLTCVHTFAMEQVRTLQGARAGVEATR